MKDWYNQYFKLYACCQPVSGIERSAIYDLQRGGIYYIPNALHEILTVFDKFTYGELLSAYAEHDGSEDLIMSYFEFLLEKELGFFTSSPELFPSLDMTWSQPEKIISAAMQIGNTQLPLKEIAWQLSELQCKHLELHVVNESTLATVVQYLSFFEGIGLRSVDLLMEDRNELLDILSAIDNVSLLHITLFNSDRQNFEWNSINVVCTEKSYPELSARDPKELSSLIINQDFFLEAQRYNPFFNRKVFIGTHGEVKNGMFTTEIHGNVFQQKLTDIIEQQDFQKLWHLNNDSIAECKDHELRFAWMSLEEPQWNQNTNEYEIKNHYYAANIH